MGCDALKINQSEKYIIVKNKSLFLKNHNVAFIKFNLVLMNFKKLCHISHCR